MVVLDFTNGRDDGASSPRPGRVVPCSKRVWCVLEHDHSGPCVEALRIPNHEIPDWDKRTRDPIGWRERKRHR